MWDLCNNNQLSILYNAESTQIDLADKRAMQLAPDGKIYIALNNSYSLGVINNPNNTNNTAASYTIKSIGTQLSQWGLPNLPGYYFEQKPTPFLLTP